MLTQLLSSKPKGRLVNLFLAHPSRSFSLTELRTNIGMGKPLLEKTVRELKKIDFLIPIEKNRKKYYHNWEIHLRIILMFKNKFFSFLGRRHSGIKT